MQNCWNASGHRKQLLNVYPPICLFLKMFMKYSINRFLVNSLLLVFGVVSAFSGLLIQVKYHMGSNGDPATMNGSAALGLNYNEWAVVHKITIVVFTLLVIYHLIHHWKWYKGVFLKRRFAKNQQVLIFSILFVLVAITGFIPWFIDLSDGNQFLRKLVMEIHDKLALILTVYLVLHIKKRMKWFQAALNSIQSNSKVTFSNSGKREMT